MFTLIKDTVLLILLPIIIILTLNTLFDKLPMHRIITASGYISVAILIASYIF